MKQLKFALLKMKLSEVLDFSQVSALRGFISTYFQNELLANRKNNRIRYTASLVQYKIMDGEAILVGIDQGAEMLEPIYQNLTHLDIHGHSIKIQDKIFTSSLQPIGISPDSTRYKFATPWIPLNQVNFQQYRELERTQNIQQQNELLQRILIGNIIAFSKHFSYEVESPILVQDLSICPEFHTFKRVNVLGFSGQFAVNFILPPYWGIGRVPSRGFGTIVHIEESCKTKN